MFYRIAEDDFPDVGVLHLDVRSDYETAAVLRELFTLFIPHAYALFECNDVITKIPVYAVERIRAAQEYSFLKSDGLLIGTHDRYTNNGYWIIHKSES